MKFSCRNKPHPGGFDEYKTDLGMGDGQHELDYVETAMYPHPGMMYPIHPAMVQYEPGKLCSL